MFDKAFKRVNTFDDFRTKLVEGKEKRAGEELIQESLKKQKVEDDKETVELKQLMKIIPDKEEVAINVIPLAVKSPGIPKKKEQIRLDEEATKRLQEQFDEEERLTGERAQQEQANIAFIEEWDDVQAKINVDYQLAERLQVQEQDELSDAEKATLFMQLLEKRRKHFAAKRAEEKKNKPPTHAQKRKIMCTYLKNMEVYTFKQLKSFEFDKIQEMFDKAFKRVNTFDDFRTKLVEGKEKRAGEELIQESLKKQKVEDDKETVELK
nr:hypothetical protein [Tanacetum cinerariifolium]